MVSAALVVKREEPGHVLKFQRPVYFISEVLTETKACYKQVQKLLYAMLMATKKLQHYFTDHEVTVITSFPLDEVVHSRDATGHISKRALELMGYDIKYAPRAAIKSHPKPTRQGTPLGDPLWHLWAPCSPALTGQQSLSLGVFTGQPHYVTWKNSSARARGANSTPGRRTY
jgi:hypothetical protein